MKKLMVALACVAFAAVSQASTINWKTSTYVFDGTGGTGRIAKDTPVYLFFGETSDADALVKAMTGSGYSTTVAGDADVTGAFTTLGKFDIKKSETTESGTQNAYFVLFNGDKMFVSEVASASYESVSSTFNVSFAPATANSKAAALDAKAGYKGAGWYNVPEPTSGLLLVLGVAGLALRRRRA